MSFLNHNSQRLLFKYLVCIISVLCISVGLLSGQEYRMPPKAIADLVDAPPTPGVSISPNGEWMLLTDRYNLPSIAELAQPELRIAGLRINPRNNGPSRSRPTVKLTFKNINSLDEIEVDGLPDNARINTIRWSPDSKHIAFTISKEKNIELWVAETGSGKARQLIKHSLNATYGSPLYWLSDSKTIVCKVVDKNRGDHIQAPTVPGGPITHENIGKTAPARTYQDLLKNQYDKELFEYYLATKILLVSLQGKVNELSQKGLISRVQPSPDGKYILVETIHRPFSYLVPVYRFPKRVEILDLDGMMVHQVVDLPLAEEVPIGRGSVPTGHRSINWRADAPAMLYWVEAQDGGNAKAKADIRDKVFTLNAPFKNKPEHLISLQFRYRGIYWGSDDIALASERWPRSRLTRTWLVKPGSRNDEPNLIFDYSYEDRYNNPGNPLTMTSKWGTSVLQTTKDNKSIFLSGTGASPEGNRPFLDKMNLKSKEKQRLWRSQAPYYERVAEILDVNKLMLLTRRESKTSPPNYFLRNLTNDKIQQITEFPHPAPQLIDIQKELITYQRKDGVQLSGTLYLPAGYKLSDGPLPVLMWAYPREFKSAAAASQVIGSPYQFVRISSSSPLLFLTQGFAVLDGPGMPIVGEGDKEPNDTFIEQLVSSAEAAIEEVVRRGVGDRDRMAISGHSYGAFMTANLLAHSDLFRAGIARSGAYNRTFTPFGFQNEERTFWQAPDIYFKMSPFMHADKVNEPILLIHGVADNNSGTFPIQSIRYYNALKGHGSTARLVMLPHESHGYRARESVMHTLWEMSQWLDEYVKNAVPRKTTLGSN